MSVGHPPGGTLEGVKELQTLALGLVVVFLDVSTPDWIADPIGWVLVLVALAAVRERLPDHRQVSLAGWTCLALSVVTWPESSVAHLDGWLELLFSLPTLAFCFLLCDSLRDVTAPAHRPRFAALCWAYALLVVAPVVVYGFEQEWLSTPSSVVAVAVNVALVLVLVGASDEDAHVPHGATGDDRAGDRDAGGASSDRSAARDPRDGSGEGSHDHSEDRGKHRA